jgi:hypothetical protein
MTDPIILSCPNHGSVEWRGDVFCKNCNSFFLGSELIQGDEAPKYVYPDAPPKGMCTCGKRLFGGTDFTARPMCHECAVTVMNRKAAQEGEILWRQECPHGGVRYPENFNDYADPLGDHSFELWTFENGDHWNWEVDYPEGHCGGEAKTQELAREYAKRVYALLVKLAEENP